MEHKDRAQHFLPGEELVSDELRVTLLGTGTPYPRRGQASAGLLVEAGDEKLLLDCGPGSPANLAALEVPLELIDKVFITHHHMDHIGGIDQLWIGGWTYGRKAPLQLWGPEGTQNVAEHLRGMYEWDIATRARVLPSGGEGLVANEYSTGLVYESNGLRVTAFEVIHAEPHNSFGFRNSLCQPGVIASGRVLSDTHFRGPQQCLVSSGHAEFSQDSLEERLEQQLCVCAWRSSRPWTVGFLQFGQRFGRRPTSPTSR